MIIGVPKELKNNEYRVSITPGGVYELVREGNTVVVQSWAGSGSGFEDPEYKEAGARVISTIDQVYQEADMIVKVKEPVEKEYGLIKKGQLVFTYLHLSSNKGLAKALIKSGGTFIAYETIEKDGHFPLLAPMSEIAGREAAIIGAYYQGNQFGGRGLLIGGATGVLPGRVLVLGAGVVGKSAAKIASGLGAYVVMMSPFIKELMEIELGNYMDSNVVTKMMSHYDLMEELKKTDVLISAVYVKGARTPVLVTRDMVAEMKKGSVIVAVDIDQGSSVETAHPTTHEDPIYIEEGVVHYCVANMPGIYSRTSTIALTNLTLSYVKRIAAGGIKAILSDKELLSGLNIFNKKITYAKVAEDLGMLEHYKEIKI